MTVAESATVTQGALPVWTKMTFVGYDAISNREVVLIGNFK